MYIKCDNWQDLPVGEFLVKVKPKRSIMDKDTHEYNDSRNYHIARCFLNGVNHKIAIVGGNFSFDMGDLVAYKEFERYEEVV